MVWVSVDGVWRVDVRQRGDDLWYAVTQHGALRRQGRLASPVTAVAELAEVMAGIDGAPAFDEMRLRN